jgi:zinc transport system substrate-binding protein
MILRRTFLLVIFSLLFLCGCSERGREEKKVSIVTTILPLAEFTEKVGGERVTVSVIIPPGSSPHTYEPTPDQLVKVKNSKVFIKVGTAIDFELTWLPKILSSDDEILVIDASESVKLLAMDHSHTEKKLTFPHSTREGNKDPHIWLSPVNAQTIVDNIYEGLCEVDPENRGYYEENKTSFLNELKTLHQEILSTLSSKEGGRFIVFHPAWGYFAEEYHLIQTSIEVEGKEPTAKDITSIIDLVKIEGIRAVFASPQINTESSEVIAREADVPLILIDPLAKEYIENLRKVSKEIYKTIP